jgi:hypothetical protein
MAMTSAERQRRYIQRLKDEAAGVSDEERVSHKYIDLLKQYHKLERTTSREIDRLRRKLEAVSNGNPSLEHTLTVPERILEHLSEAKESIQVDLERPKSKRKVAKLERIMSDLHWCWQEFYIMYPSGAK